MGYPQFNNEGIKPTDTLPTESAMPPAAQRPDFDQQLERALQPLADIMTSATQSLVVVLRRQAEAMEAMSRVMRDSVERMAREARRR